jgi:dipeptidyl aminopeptidase/acylaminoacyl peptidase
MLRSPLSPCALLALGGLLFDPAAVAQTPYSGHGAQSVSPETIRKYAPPPLDPLVSRRIQTMLDVRSPGLGIVAPDGKRLFFGWSITGTPTVWRLDAPRGFPVQMTGGEDPTRLVGLTPDGRFAILSRDRGGQEDPGLYLQPAEGGALRAIQHQPGSRAFYAFTTRDSKAVYFRANDRKPDSYALYRYDLGAGTKELLFSEDGLWSIADRREEPEEVKLLLQKATGALSSELFEWGTKGRTLKPLLGQGEKTEYEAAYALDPSELLVLTNKLGEFRRLYRWTAANGLVPVTPDVKMDVSGFAVDPPRRHVYTSVNDGGYTRLRVLDARTLEPLPFPEIKDADHVFAGTPSEDGRYVTIGVEGARAPRASYVYDWETKALTQWVLPGAPEVDVSKFAVARLESYPARDGTKIPMFVRYPAGCAPEAPAPTEPCPIVVEFHGGPEGQAQPGFSSWAQLFVDAGFVFVEPNVRGSDGYGKSWLDADNGPKRLGVITDIDDCGKHLRRRFTRDGKVPKVAITGGSYGGYSTLVGMTMFAGTYDVGVSIVGISNLVTFLQNTAPYRRLLRATEYGDPDKDAEALRKLSPVTYLDRVKSPLLLIQGVDDPRVPAGEAVQIHEALQARGISSALILMEGEGHGAARRSGQVVEAGNTLRFLEEHLLGKRATGSD